MKNIIIEAPKVGEENEIERFFEITINAAFEEQGVGHLTEFIAEEVESKMQMVRNFLEGSKEYYFMIAKIEDSIVGTISFGSCGNIIRQCCEGQLNDVGELGSLYVLPRHQDQGIGSKLINSLILHLKQNQIENFCLDSGFKKAQKRWTRKFGEPYKIMKDYWGPSSDHFIWYCRVKEF